MNFVINALVSWKTTILGVAAIAGVLAKWASAGAIDFNDIPVILAGFTDERGTAEYNRGLGERRAQAVRQALIEKGLPASRIQTVSFGAEMPVDSASNESAWAKNRRAEFGVTK